MKTLLVSPWDDCRGGAQVVTLNLAKHLQAQGNEVLFFHPGKAILLKRRITSQGFPGVELRVSVPFGRPRPIVSALAFPVLFPIVFIQLLSFLRKERIQIVNLHYLMDSFFYFAICRHLIPIRLVTSIHGSDAFSLGKPRQQYSRAFKFLLAASDLITVPSNAYRQKLLERFPALDHKVVFIHNGIRPGVFMPSKNLQNPHGQQRYILCAAGLKPEKAIDVLLHASKPLLASDSSLQLVLVGDGPLRGDLEDLASALGIRNQTQFLGSKESTEVARLMQRCAVFVLPSRAESFGMVVLEAMACKRPVVASAVGGIPEIIEHEKSGILVPPDNPEALAEALRAVLTNPRLGETIADNGHRRVVESFCFNRTGEAFENAFASVLGLSAD
jgi:glycosyltransferase involved in cell wall biosynthesis